MSDSRWKTYFEVILVAIVLMFVCAIGVGVMVDVFWASDAKAPDAFRGGFIGAFFAFLSVRIADLLTKLNDKAKRNSSALITLQHRYMDIAGEIHDNIYLLSIWDQMIEAMGKDDRYPLWTNKLFSVQIPRTELTELSNIDLVNELFSLNTKIRKMNHSLETFSSTYEKVSDALVNQKMQAADYVLTVKRMNKDRFQLAEFLESLILDLEKALSAIRILLRRKTLSQKFIEGVTASDYARGFEEARAKELDSIKAEISETKNRSALEIEQVEKRAAQKWSDVGLGQ